MGSFDNGDGCIRSWFPRRFPRNSESPTASDFGQAVAMSSDEVQDNNNPQLNQIPDQIQQQQSQQQQDQSQPRKRYFISISIILIISSSSLSKGPVCAPGMFSMSPRKSIHSIIFNYAITHRPYVDPMQRSPSLPELPQTRHGGFMRLS